MIQIQAGHDIKNYTIIMEYSAKIRATIEVLNCLVFGKGSFSLSLAAKRFFNEHKLNGHGYL